MTDEDLRWCDVCDDCSHYKAVGYEKYQCTLEGGRCRGYFAYKKLKAENAALRERLEKAITPEFKIYEDVYFIDYVNEKGYSEYTTGKPKIREAFITCVSQSTQTEFLYRLQPKDLPQERLNDSTIHDEWWDWQHFFAKEIFKTREAALARLAELKGEQHG